MAIPESARGQILDAQRLIAFKFESPVNVLVLYDVKGAELVRIDHFWNIDKRTREGMRANTDVRRIRIVEDGQSLDAVLADSDSARYQVETSPPTLSEPLQVRVANRPEAGRNREWVLAVSKPKFKSKFFGERP